MVTHGGIFLIRWLGLGATSPPHLHGPAQIPLLRPLRLPSLRHPSSSAHAKAPSAQHAISIAPGQTRVPRPCPSQIQQRVLPFRARLPNVDHHPSLPLPIALLACTLVPPRPATANRTKHAR
ncbi:hypothetical protein AcW1_005777 [Taiwanofungus camphoratus]|nr:hypothetical protein AcW1_005777 [Antrodia cinnamomea]